MAVTCSLTGASELRIGESSSSFFSPGGVQRVMSHPIGMKTKPRRRTGLAGVLASAVAAGTIASSNGSASVAPIPRRNVRRGRAFFVITIRISSVKTGFHAVRLTQIPSVCTKENWRQNFVYGTTIRLGCITMNCPAAMDYEKILGAESVLDQFHIHDETMDHCRRELARIHQHRS